MKKKILLVDNKFIPIDSISYIEYNRNLSINKVVSITIHLNSGEVINLKGDNIDRHLYYLVASFELLTFDDYLQGKMTTMNIGDFKNE